MYNENVKKLTFILTMISDLISISFSFFLAHSIRETFFPSLFNSLGIKHLKHFTFYIPLLVQMLILWLIVGAITGIYRRNTFWNDVKLIWENSFFVTILAFTFSFVAKKEVLISRVILLLTLILSLILVPLFRVIFRKIMLRFGIGKRKVAIIGTGKEVNLLKYELEKNWYKGYELLGVVKEINRIDRKIKELRAEEVFILSSYYDEKSITAILTRLEGRVEINIVSNLSRISLATAHIENLGTVMVLIPPHNLYRKLNLFVKRCFDIFIATISVIILSPVFLIISIAIKLDSKGPVLFKQKRLGRGEKPFTILKFRTMFIDSDKRLRKYLNRNPEAQKEWEKYRKLKNDPRVTKVGKFLRRWSLDELPQLINVLRGEMSVVGPRPYLPEERGRIGRYRKIIYRVKPGITGLWQVRGRNKLPFETRLALDEFYVRNWSLWFDIMILIQTIEVVIARRGAY